MINNTENRGINREYKDRLFKFIFGNPENKAWTLSLYNAVNGTNYDNSYELKLTTIDDVVYMGMRNDTSFIVSDTMNLYEQQSSFDPNITLRFLIYAGMLYERYIETSDSYRKYSSKQQRVPTPKCICFYNGTAKKEDRITLSLSDAFAPGTVGDIEVKVTMININYGHNRELLEDCKPLSEYSWLVDRVRAYQSEGFAIEKAVDETIKEMPDGYLIKKFLVTNRAEVKHMFMTEFDEEQAKKDWKEDGRDEGREEGRKEGREEGLAEGLEKGIEKGLVKGRVEGMINTLAGMVKKGILTLTQASEEAGMSVSEFESRSGLKA